MAEDKRDRVTLASEAEKFRKMLSGDSRSATLVRLLDYLVEHSASARAPKEIEIALAVFGKTTEFDPSQNSMVRVQMHRLRNRLDGFYVGRGGPRLHIPKGEYRILLSDVSKDAEGGRAWAWVSRLNPWHLLAGAGLASVVIWALLLLGSHQDKQSVALAQTSLWQSIANSKQSPLIVAGVSYMFGLSEGDRKVDRLIMRPGIQSETDFEAYLREHPEEFRKVHDVDVHYMTGNTALSLWPIMSLVAKLHPGDVIPDITPASRVSRQALNDKDIVYIGRLDELSALHPLVFHNSGFDLQIGKGALKDRRTGTTYVALPEVFEEAENRKQGAHPDYVHDYGYLARFPGAPGKQIVVIAGLQDLALPRMTALVSDKRELDILARRTKGAAAFEALYEVRSLGGLKYETRLLMARPLKTSK